MDIKQISKSVNTCDCNFCNSNILSGSRYLYVRCSGTTTYKICDDCSRLFKIFGDFDYLSDFNNWIVVKNQMETILHLCKVFNIDLNKLLNFYEELFNSTLIFYDKNIFSIIIQYILTFNCRQRIIINNDILCKIRKLELLIKNKYDVILDYKFDQLENIFIFKFNGKLNQIIVNDLYNLSKDILSDNILYYFV